MDEKTINYEQQYKDLGINVRPLPSNYSPDSYARLLMNDVQKPQSVEYTSTTDYVTKKPEEVV